MEKGILLENKLLDFLPDDIRSAIRDNKTPFGDNPAFPDIYDIPYLEKIASASLKDATRKLENIGSIDDVEGNDLYSAQAQLIKKCQEIERPYRNELEKVCYNNVVDMFRIPSDSVKLELELKDSVDVFDSSIILDPVDGDDNFEISDIAYAKAIKKEIYKRRILNALCVGHALQVMGWCLETCREDLDRISEELCPLYEKIFALNSYLLLAKEDIGIDDNHLMLDGLSVLYLGNDMNMNAIKAEATIFPFLLYETVKSLSELFISHGLPENIEITRYILGKTDYVKAEPWNMRVGLILWRSFSNSISDTMKLPYLLKMLSCIKPKNFFKISNEILAKTRKGNEYLNKIAEKVDNDFEYEEFVDKMDKMKEKNGIITDEFIHPDEL